MATHISIKTRKVVCFRIANTGIVSPAELWFTTTDGRNMRLVPAGIRGMIDTEVFIRAEHRSGWRNYAMTLAMTTAFHTPHLYYAIYH